MQCVLNRIPPFTFWLVLAVPFVAAPPYMYAALSTGELCFSIVDCFNAESAMILNRTGMNLLVFLLLTFCAVRTFPTLPGDDVVRHHRYFLILTLICLHVVLLGLDISLVGKYVSDEQHLFLATLVKLCFLYFVMISVFRFFSEAFTVPETKMVSEEPELSEKEKQIALQLVDLLNKEKIYCDLHISRDRLAEKLNIKTYQLSHIINRHFEKSYTDLISDHRVDDAKQRLMSSSEPITAIAYDVGFGSIASFNRVFKERCGMSPSAYRTKNRKNIVFS
jgi:AraC-like DNA-binding protein